MQNSYRYSKLFGKTRRDVAKSQFVSHELLIKGGFIAESVAGRYFLLPLGWRVHEKIKQVIKLEMDRAGAQEMISPTLHPLELWQETNRTDTTGFELMKVVDRRGAEFALGGTAEEMFVDIVRKFNLSYKDLPINLYQFSVKFRDELRARGGLLRVREFMMKDAYSFHVDKGDFEKEYRKMAQTYTAIFHRLGLETLMVEADNGYIGGEYSHEFQVEHHLGEGTFFISEDGRYRAHEDVAKFKLQLVNPDESVKKLQIIDQPEWVQTMEDNAKHYGKDKRFFLKNVVYKNHQGDIIIVTIRGDLEVNKVKLEQVLDLVGQLEEASSADLALIGTKPGYVHAWGHRFIKPLKCKTERRNCRVIYVADQSLRTVKNFIGGQKKTATDSINVNYGRDFKHEIEADVALAQTGFFAPDGKSKLIRKHGIEVGNIFQFGYYYSKRMAGATFIDQAGKAKPYYMGCYGIGLGRTLAAIVEKNHDDKGIIWPKTVAPFQVYLVSLAGGEALAEKIYQQLQESGVEVLYDDRHESAGIKLADADLIGCPIRLVTSKRNGEMIEVKERSRSKEKLVSIDKTLKLIRTINSDVF